MKQEFVKNNKITFCKKQKPKSFWCEIKTKRKTLALSGKKNTKNKRKIQFGKTGNKGTFNKIIQYYLETFETDKNRENSNR